MSETFLQEIADQLRGQTSPAEPTPVEPAAVEPTPVNPTPVEPAPVATATPAVNDQITDSVTVKKEWWEDDQPNPPADPKPVDDKKTEITEPSFDLDEDLKLLLEYKKSGKTLKDFVNEYKIQDYSTWDDSKIIAEGLKEFMSLSDEEMEQAKYEFDSASIFQKKQMVDSFKQKFEQKNEGLLKQLTSSNVQVDERQKAVSDIFNSQLDTFSKEIVDKEVYGMKITDEMSKDLRNFIEKEFTLQRQDGTFDVEKMYSIGLWLKYGKDLVKANITKAKNEGKEQVIREVSNPSKNNTGGGRVVGSGLEAAQEAFNTLFPG
jgi:hypothetical protein